MLATITNTRPGSYILGLFSGTYMDRYNDLGNDSKLSVEEAMNNIKQNQFNFGGYIASALNNGEFSNVSADISKNKAVSEEISKDLSDTNCPFRVF